MTDRAPINGLKAKVLFIFGWFCVGLGAVGAILPLLPTTPFLLLALWAFARSSPKFQSWLWSHNLLGPFVRDWVKYRAIPVKAKIMAVLMMSLSLFWLIFYSNLSVYVIGFIGLCLACVATYLLSRPNSPD
jgi:uncharacterized membrane protein YbaN (DUF454 family)